MSLVLFLGCMFSGKSTSLMTHVSRYRAVGKSCVVVNHSNDTRCSEEIKTHAGHAMRAIKSASLSSVDVDVADIVGVDEGQFFKDLNVVLDWVKRGKHVAVAGLSGDFRAQPFSNMTSLIPHADEMYYKKALCMECGAPAIFSKRVVDSTERLLTGGKEQYVAVCRAHFNT